MLNHFAKMKKTLLLLLLMTTATELMAIPAYPAKKKLRKSDGSQIEVTLRGDEHFSFWSGNDGNQYVRQSGKYVSITSEEIDRQWTARKQQYEQQQQSSRRKSPARRGATGFKGNKRGLVVLMYFDDQAFSVSDPAAFFKNQFNKIGYNGNGQTGSVRDYFLEQSYGQLDIEFDVAGPYKADYAMSRYGAPSGGGNDSSPWDLIVEACKKADKDVDYRNYDWNDDGTVDQVFVVYAGYGQNYGASEYTIWPHEFNLTSVGKALTLDTKKVSTYACSCELYGRESEEKVIDGIGPACHEFSHCLGLPDMYDTSSAGSGQAMLNWDVMASGSYNNYGRTPAGFTAYERMFSGWLTPVELNTITEVSGMKPLAKNAEAYILYNDNNRNEFYMLENRQQVGFDASLNGHGLLVTHIDYDADKWSSNDVNSNAAHPRCAVVPADGALVYNSPSLAADPFPGALGKTELTNYTTPAMKLFNENTDGTFFLSKPLDHITEDGEQISFTACRPEMGIPNVTESKSAGERAWTLTWDAVQGAVGYELELTEQPAAKHNPEECLLIEEDFSGFYSKSNGLSDVSGKISNYMKSGTGWAGNKLFTSPKLLRIGTNTASGYINSPSMDMPESGEVTVVIGAELFDQNTPVEGSIKIITDEGSTSQQFTISKDGKLLFTFQMRATKFRIGVNPVGRMYLNYMAIYEGTYTEEELGLTEAKQRETASDSGTGRQIFRLPLRKAKEPVTYTTSEPTYTFHGLTPGSTYFCKIRAIGEYSNSLWSEETEFKIEGVDYIVGDVNEDGEINISDVVAVINVMAGSTSYPHADVNADNAVDISDVVNVIGLMAGQ